MPRLLRFLHILSAATTILAAASIQAETFGITPDDPTSLIRGIAAAATAGASAVQVPPGVYRLANPAEGSPLSSRYHLVFSKLKNLDIDATDAVFVATTRNAPMVKFVHCSAVTLRGAIFVHEMPPFSQGKVTAISPARDAVEIQVDPGYPEDLDNGLYFGRNIPEFNAYEATGGIPKRGVPDIYISPPVRLGPGLFRFPLLHRLGSDIPLIVGDRVAWRGTGAPDLSLDFCQNMRFLDVTIRASSMQGISECGCTGNHYSRCAITYGPRPPGAADDPLLSTNADGFFLHTGGKGPGPTLEDCLIEGVDDDGVAIHGLYAMGVASDGNRITCDAPSLQHSIEGQFCQPGDLLRFYDATGAFAGEAKVLSATPRPEYHPREDRIPNSRRFRDRSRAEYWEYELDHAIPVQFDWRVANVDRLGSGFVVRNCVIRNGRNSGFRLKADDGLVESCRIENIVNQGIILTPEPASFNESDYCRRVVLRGNVLREVNLSGHSPAALVVTSSDFAAPPPFPVGHRDLLIENNRIEGSAVTSLYVSCTDGLRILNNVFTNPFAALPIRQEHSPAGPGTVIWLAQDQNVVLSGNRIETPGPLFRQAVGTDGTVRNLTTQPMWDGSDAAKGQ